MNKTVFLMLTTVIMTLIAVSCSANFKHEGIEEKIKLNFYSYMARETFMDEIKRPVEEKFPHIELVYNNINVMTFQPSYEQADIFHSFLVSYLWSPKHMFVNSWSFDVREGDPFPSADLSPYITPDSSIHLIDPNLRTQANWRSVDGETNVLPYTQVPTAMFYNKSLLEQYNLPFPEDNMTWDAVLEYVKLLPEGNKINLDPYHKFPMYMYQASLPPVKSAIDETFAELRWREIIDLMAQANHSGNRPRTDSTCMCDGVNAPNVVSMVNQIIKYPSYLFPTFHFNRLDLRYGEDPIIRRFIEAENEGLDLDIVTYPVFSARPEYGNARVRETLQASKHRPHVEEAFRVIEYLLSPDIQKRNARNGLGPVIVSEEIIQEFGANIPQLQNKNLQAFFQLTSAPQAEGKMAELEAAHLVLLPIGTELFKVYSGETDAESALNEIMKLYKYLIQ